MFKAFLCSLRHLKGSFGLLRWRNLHKHKSRSVCPPNWSLSFGLDCSPSKRWLGWPLTLLLPILEHCLRAEEFAASATMLVWGLGKVEIRFARNGALLTLCLFCLCHWPKPAHFCEETSSRSVHKGELSLAQAFLPFEVYSIFCTLPALHWTR